MITIDVSSIDQEFIDWKAIIQRSMTGEKVSVQKAGKEVLQILPSNQNHEIIKDSSIDSSWQKLVSDLSGSWEDFPTIEEIRAGYGEDVPREKL